MYSPSKHIQYEQCEGCLEMHGDHTMIMNDNDLYCEECYSDRFSYCSHCKEYRSIHGRGDKKNICECCQSDIYCENSDAALYASKLPTVWFNVA